MDKNEHCHPAAVNALARPRGIPADWLTPDWPAPALVHALCTTRVGGFSAGPYASMNLGSHVGDAPDAVAQNRALLVDALQGTTPGAQPVFLNQVHGSACARLATEGLGVTDWDAAITTEPGVVCTIMVADCLPVLLTDKAGHAVGAAHAGWRGLAGGILENFVERFRLLAHERKALVAIDIAAKQQAVSPDDVMAWLGPCIGPAAFEVGAEVRAAFCADDPGADRHFTASAHGCFLADLPGLARLRLNALGVTAIYGNDGSDAWCTVQQPSRFFSHRRDGASSISNVSGQKGGAAVGRDVKVGGTGRMAACIWLG